jgi:ssDNA-binding Zn-finger/Zn-ribbon topoisomerase 1
MFPLSVIERRRCPKCHTVMMLARISPAGDGREERLFECPKCDHAEMAIVEDPLKSKAAGWLASELKPPS